MINNYGIIMGDPFDGKGGTIRMMVRQLMLLQFPHTENSSKQFYDISSNWQRLVEQT